MKTRNRKQNVASHIRGIRLYIEQEKKVQLLEENGFSFQKIAREGLNEIIEAKLKLLGLSVE